LPLYFDILCTRPCLGQKVVKMGGINRPLFFIRSGLELMVQKYHYVICFLIFFYVEGCRIVERSRAEHDWHAVGSQFITFTMRWILEKLRMKSTPTNSNTQLKILGEILDDIPIIILYYFLICLFKWNSLNLKRVQV